MVVSQITKVISTGTFYNLRGLRRVVFQPGSQLGVIEREAFRECGLEEIKLPANLAEIGEDAFRGCKNLKRVTFEDGSAL